MRTGMIWGAHPGHEGRVHERLRHDGGVGWPSLASRFHRSCVRPSGLRDGRADGGALDDSSRDAALRDGLGNGDGGWWCAVGHLTCNKYRMHGMRKLVLSLKEIVGCVVDPNMEVGFCDSHSGGGFYLEQPRDQLERWTLPADNGTHLTIPWKPDRRACGLNVSSYFVDVKTSTPVLNFFMGIFGSFPQDLCDPRGSKARDAVQVEESESGGTCSPYVSWGCPSSRFTAFEVPSALRQMAKMDVTVTVRAYGTLSPIGSPAKRTPAVFWCHKYRRAMSKPPPSSGALVAGSRSPWRWLTQMRGPRHNTNTNTAAAVATTASATATASTAASTARNVPALTGAYSAHQAWLLRLEPWLVLLSVALYLGATRRMRAGVRRVGTGAGAGVGKGVDVGPPSLPRRAAAACARHVAFCVAPLCFVLLARGAPPSEAGLDVLSAGSTRLATALVGQGGAVVLLLAPRYRDAVAARAAAAAQASPPPPPPPPPRAPLLLAYHAASSVWRCAFLFAWVQPALGRALPGALCHAAVVITAVLATVADSGGADAETSLAERSLTGWAMPLGVAVGLSGLVVAAAPVAWAVGATAAGLSLRVDGEMPPPAWSDVAVEASAAALSIAVLVAWCG